MFVNVKFKARGEESFSGREYAYSTDLSLSVGDLVLAPTVKGETPAQVVRVNVPPESIPAAAVERIRDITEYYFEGVDTDE